MGKLALAAKITHVPSMYLSELDGPRKGTRQDAIEGHREIGRVHLCLSQGRGQTRIPQLRWTLPGCGSANPVYVPTGLLWGEFDTVYYL